MNKYFLCQYSELKEGQAKGFVINGNKTDSTSVLAVKKGGEIYLYKNICPHRGINLDWLPDQFLDADKAFIRCATHGALFLIESGECIAGPCAGSALIPVSMAHTAKGLYALL